MRALVLAAGLGTRLSPLTAALPKPLAPVAGRPVIEHLLARLAGEGIDSAVINVHWMADQIVSRLGDGHAVGIALSWSHEEQLLGTAGAITGARRLLGDGDVMVLSGDGLHDVALRQVARRHRESGAAATITVRRLPRPETCALVALDEAGMVTRFVEKPAPEDVFTDLASIGIYCFSPAARELVGDGPCDIARDLIPALLERGMPVAATHSDAWWSDIGTLAELTAANLAVVSGDVRTALPAKHTGTAGIQLYAGTRVAHGAVLEAPVAAGPDALIGAGARVDSAVILPGAVVPQGTVVAGGMFGDPGAVAAAWAAA
ncbi:MAG TPA: nucleotidyltransferase family protein [Solirubrobacteraceae bacterium]|jgi:NDP-sugar pyrophosphorylase family protein|nr:nucleotidyltransferase family protein [Solirubrobacteraceae bacterium]